MKLWVQQWEESERGWGVRPDGYSLHATREDVDMYIAEYTKDRNPNFVPDEYDRPCGKPYEVDIPDSNIHLAAFKSKADDSLGMRVFDNKSRPQPPSNSPGTWSRR